MQSRVLGVLGESIRLKRFFAFFVVFMMVLSLAPVSIRDAHLAISKVSAVITPPIFVQEAETVWNTTSSKTTASFNVQAGDLLVAYGVIEDQSTSLNISGGSLTWTLQQSVDVSGYTTARVWTATVDANKTMSVTFTGGLQFGGDVLTFRSSGGVGVSAKSNGSGAPSVNLTTSQDHSAVVVVSGDWNALSGTSRIWRTGAGAFTEQSYFNSSGRYTIYGGFHADVATAGTYAFGLTAPGSQKFSTIALEVKGSGTAAPDTTAPSVSLTAPANGANIAGSTTVSATAADNVGVAGVQFKLDGANMGIEDTTSPYSVTFDSRTVANGNHTLSATARDAAGNQTDAAPVSIQVSNPPVISAISVTAITTTSAQINWSTNVPADSKVNYGTTTSYGQSSNLDSSLITSHSVTLNGLTDSTLYHFQVVSKDGSGVSANSADNTFTTATPPDTTAPTVSITSPVDGATLSNTIAITANAFDNVGVSSVQFQLDGVNLGAADTTSPYSVNWDTTAVTNGSHVLSAVAKDAANNIGNSVNINVTVANPATVSAVNATNITQTSATINWNTNVPTDSLVNYGTTSSYGSQTILDSNLVTSHSQSLSNLIPGTIYHFQVVSKDSSGVTTTSGDFTFTTITPPDTTAPTISITQPLDGAVVSGTINISADATDNVGVVGVQFKLNGVDLGTEDSASPYVFAWNTGSVANGNYVLTAIARDAAGNSATAQTITVTVSNSDVTPPVISSVSSSSITPTGATISWLTNEAADSQVEYGLTTSYGSQTAVDGNLTTTHSVLLGGLASNTTYNYRVISKDAFGNTATSANFTFKTAVAGTALSIDGNQRFQTIVGFGVNANSLSWKNGELAPALDMLVDGMGASSWRVVFDMEDWEATNDNADPNTFDWTYYNSLYSNSKFQNLWGTLGYLNQKGINQGIYLSFMGRVPTWMGGSSINTSAEDEWVETMASLLYYARNTAHVQFSGLDPMNETDGDGIEGPQVDPTQYARLLHKLAVKLDAIGLSDIKFVPPAAAHVAQANNYINPLLADSTIMSKIVTFGTHNYGDASFANVVNNVKNSAYPDRNVIDSEFTDRTYFWSDIGLGASGGNLWEAYDSVYNHAILAGRGTTPPNDNTSGANVSPLAYNQTTGVYTPRSYFYEYSVFKYVVPGSIRIAANESNGNVTTYAFYEPITGRITIIGKNSGSATNFTATFSNLPALTTMQEYQVNSNSFARLADVQVVNQTVSFPVPSQTSFTVTGLALPDETAPTAPSNLTAVGSVGKATLNWTSSTDNVGVSYYNVYRSTTSNFVASAANKIAQTTVANYTDLTNSGTYYYQVTAQDAAGNVSNPSNEATATVGSDSTAPTVSITTPTDNQTILGTVSVSATATDDVGVAGVQFLLDGANLGSEVTTVPYTISFNTTTTTSGTHQLSAVARDGAGNVMTSSVVNVNVDNDGPNGSVEINGGADATNSRTATLTLSAADNFGSVTQMRFSNTGTSFSTAEAYNTTKTWTLSTGSGTKTVYVQFKDNFGNWSVSYTDTIVLDTTAPTISSITTSNLGTNTVTIKWTTSEPATSQVDFGTTTSYGQSSPEDTTLVTSHSVTLTGLNSKTFYDYRIRSKDAAGNQKLSSNKSFTTK